MSVPRLLALNGLHITKVGFRESWHSKRLPGYTLDIPVPASYNDLFVNSTIRDYLGWAWYQVCTKYN